MSYNDEGLWTGDLADAPVGARVELELEGSATLWEVIDRSDGVRLKQVDN